MRVVEPRAAFSLAVQLLKNRPTQPPKPPVSGSAKNTFASSGKQQRGLRLRGACFDETIARFREASLAGPCIHGPGVEGALVREQGEIAEEG